MTFHTDSSYVFSHKNFAGMWKGNYCKVFNSLTNTCDKAEIEEYISSEVDVESINVCVSEIVEAIKYLPHNKSPRHDSLMSEHFQYVSHRLPVLLAVLFKLMLQHGYLPDSFMLAMLVPILKSKTGDITSTGNYSPIAIATVCSKIMETCLVSRLESFFYILMIISLLPCLCMFLRC